MSEAHARELFAQFSTDNKLRLPEFVEIVSPFKNDVSKLLYGLLYLAADSDKKGYLNEDDWLQFVRTLTQEDGEFKTLFNLFSHGKSTISYDEALKELNELNRSIDPTYQQKKAKLNWTYFSMFFEPLGKISYLDFVTLINYLPITKLIGLFEVMSGKLGYISEENLVELLQRNLNHKLSSKLRENLSSLPKYFDQDKFTIANVLYVYNALSKLDLVNEVLANSPPTLKDKGDILINKADLYDHINDHLLKLSNFSTILKLELDLLYYLVGKGTETVPRRELVSIFNPNFENSERQLYATFEHPAAQPVVSDNFSLWPIFDSLYSFFLGSIAGCIGATVVYPIDLVKTRMQAQRHKAMYNNSLDCFKKIITHEGVKGLYSGLAAQLVGVAPEKAIKLTVNDLVRKIGTDDLGHITMNWEIIAGMLAGACQVIFTNPLEIVKIRLQMQGNQKLLQPGEIPLKKLTAGKIVKQLGIKGLYKGASACLLRDVPFSAIYFPTYANLKKVLFNYDPNEPNASHRLTSWQLLTSGALAGAPAAFFTTPADVIKTRLQMELKSGEVKYKGIAHAGRVILKEEGFGAFFKGSLARVFRSSPQFGFTLASYEILQGLFPLHPPMNKESNFKSISGYPGVYLLTNDQVYTNNERIMYFNAEDFKTPLKPSGINDALVKVPAQIVYKSQDTVKLLLDIDYKFGNFNYDSYLKFVQK